MKEVTYISYAEWMSLINAVLLRGLSCAEMDALNEVYPRVTGKTYDSMIYNQLAKLEEYMLKETIRIFQKKINSCLEENDLEILEPAFVELKNHILKCLFFLQIPDYPESVKNELAKEIKKRIDAFMDSFVKYIRKIEKEDYNYFIQEYVYVCRKKVLKIKKLY